MALMSRLESNVDFERLTALLDDSSFEPARASPAIAALRFLLNPKYKDITEHSPKCGRPVLYGSLVECLVRNFGKGFILASLGTSLLDILPYLLRGDIRRAWRALLLPIHLKHGLAFGLFVSVFNSTLYVVSRGSAEEMCNARKKHGWLAGLLAGASVGLAPKETRHFTAKLTFTRSLEVLCRMIYQRSSPQVKRWLDQVGLSRHLDTLIFSLSSRVVLEEYLDGGDHLEKSYRKFLNVQGGKSRANLDAIRDNLKGDSSLKPCQACHPETDSCSLHAFAFFSKAFTERSLPIYYRVFAIPLLFGFIQGKQPRKSVLHFIKAVGQSSLFLSMYCTSAWISYCSVSDAPLWVRKHIRPWLTAVFAGSTLLIEKQSRRIEVALYVMTHAINVLLCKSSKKGINFPDHSETIVSMLCCSFLLNAYLNEDTKEAQLIRPGYRFLLERFLDSKSQRHATIIPAIIATPLNH